MDEDLVFKALLNLAREKEPTLKEALIALNRAGKIAEVYLSGCGGEILFETFDRSSSAETI